MVGLHIETNENSHFARGGHPESAGRLTPVKNWLREQSNSGKFLPIEINQFGLDPVNRVHSKRYVDQLNHACRNGAGHLDPDTYVSEQSFESAQRVVDSVLSAVDAAMTGELRSSFLLVRPPGHHAEHDRAMGFCLFNNVAVAAQHLIDRHKVSKVAIVDFDVHHGNGTQHIFYDRPDVYFISTHQYPFYPGTGSVHETGSGAGKGFNLNIPLAAGAGDLQLVAAFEQQILPALGRYQPEFILVSAGFDAHRLDPLGGLNVTGSGFKAVAELLTKVAAETANGRIVSILEGGYDPQGNLDSISNYLLGLDHT